MNKILVTGGSGMLGRRVVSKLTAMGYTIRSMSHHPQPNADNIEWVQADLATGSGLAEAVSGVDTIVHLASKPRLVGKRSNVDEPGNVDVHGTKLMLEHARAAGVKHCLYISIVGIERVPMPYFRQKLATEDIVRNSGVDWTIARVTQFHPFIGFFLQSFNRLPLLFFPTDLQFQPVAIEDTADYLCRWVKAGPSGRVTDLGGPEILTTGAMMQTWLKANHRSRRIIAVHWPGKIAAAMRKGNTLCPDGERGTGTWAEWAATQASPTIGQAREEYSLRR